MAKSSQEKWIGFLGLVDYLTEKWEDFSFRLHDWQEEVMERGEEADEDFRGFLRTISRKKGKLGESSTNGDASPGPAPALEQSKATPLREALKRGPISTHKPKAAEVIEQEIDSVIQHLEE